MRKKNTGVRGKRVCAAGHVLLGVARQAGVPLSSGGTGGQPGSAHRPHSPSRVGPSGCGGGPSHGTSMARAAPRCALPSRVGRRQCDGATQRVYLNGVPRCPSPFSYSEWLLLRHLRDTAVLAGRLDAVDRRPSSSVKSPEREEQSSASMAQAACNAQLHLQLFLFGVLSRAQLKTTVPAGHGDVRLCGPHFRFRDFLLHRYARLPRWQPHHFRSHTRQASGLQGTAARPKRSRARAGGGCLHAGGGTAPLLERRDSAAAPSNV
mmetsp:Transcript_18716/g.33395  ORF Transcript_18716/g.33395 Transcript_18716/m.33395 type:complete len:264 (+) Transcript_18716:779-1570(+)